MPRMTGARFLAETMKEYGVTHAFYMPMVVTRALVEFENLGIERIMTHGEKAAAYMADGYARASRRPAVCMAQNVGAANLAAGLQDAYLAHSPVVAIYRTPWLHGPATQFLPGSRPCPALQGGNQVPTSTWTPRPNCLTPCAKPSGRLPPARPARYTWGSRAPAATWWWTARPTWMWWWSNPSPGYPPFAPSRPPNRCGKQPGCCPRPGARSSSPGAAW